MVQRNSNVTVLRQLTGKTAITEKPESTPFFRGGVRTMYKIAICDDEIVICQQIEDQLITFGKAEAIPFEIDIFYTAEALIEHMRSGISYDFLILDIELYRLTGIDVGKYLREENRNFHTQIVFVSSKETYAMKLFSVQPLDFLVKPVESVALVKALKRGFEIIGESGEFFTYKTGRGTSSISCNEILYLMSEKRIIILVCRDETIEYYGKLSEELKRLPECFAQIHTSYVVNLNAIKKSGNDFVVMNNGDQISISRKFADSFKNTLFLRWKRSLSEV